MSSVRSALIASVVSCICTAYAQRPNDSISTCCDLNAGYDPVTVADQAMRLASHSWEYGTAAEALLELYDPSLSVFSPAAFPNSSLPTTVNIPSTPGLAFLQPFISLSNTTLIYGDGATGDPASLGPATLLIAQSRGIYLPPAIRQMTHFYTVPRWEGLNYSSEMSAGENWGGAISQREEEVSLWADFIFMAPPFFAVFGVAMNTTDAVRLAVRQCGLYREVLQVRGKGDSDGGGGGAWRHIVGGKSQDLGIWSTGNGWAAFGMARVLGTIVHWGCIADEGEWREDVKELLEWIGEILEAAMEEENLDRENGLLRNYWDLAADQEPWFGETSGSALIAAAVFRVAVLQREMHGLFEEQETAGPVTVVMLSWAENMLQSVAKHVSADGIASPAVDPLDWHSRTPYTKGSPEGQSFVVMLYAAWRDCVRAGVCVT